MGAEQAEAKAPPVRTARASLLPLLLTASAVALVLQLLAFTAPTTWSRRTWIWLSLAASTALFAGALALQNKFRATPIATRWASRLEWVVLGCAIAILFWIRPPALVALLYAADARSWSRLTWFCWTFALLFALVARQYCPDLIQSWAAQRAAAAEERRKKREAEERRDRRLESEELQRRRDQLYK